LETSASSFFFAFLQFRHKPSLFPALIGLRHSRQKAGASATGFLTVFLSDLDFGNFSFLPHRWQSLQT
jgi:hypothetical protein